MHFFYISLVLFILQASASAKSTPRQVVWGSVAFIRNGETVPYGLSGARTLTPVGAQQLAGAGYAFRSRYLTPSLNPSLSLSKIKGLSSSLNNDEIQISSTSDQNVAASAQAFMQGLYPPSIGLADSGNILSNMADANGSTTDYPLNGYQYPLISTYRAEDPISAHISGHRNCPRHTEAVWAFASTKPYKDLFERTRSFYGGIYARMLVGVYTRDMASVLYAPLVYEYLNYQYTYNSTARGIISRADVEKARQYANEWAHETSSSADVSWSKDRMLAIGGRSLAYSIMFALQQNERTQGSSNKLSLLFGGYEPMMAFINIAISAQHRKGLNGIPNYGASMVIDLFSVEEEDGLVEYPSDDSKLMVRFMLRNGTDASDPETNFTPHPMFGNSLHQTAMPYKEFVSQMVYNMKSTSEWCRSCNSRQDFCSQYVNHQSNKGCGVVNLHPTDTVLLLFLGATILLSAVSLVGISYILWRCLRNKRKRRVTLPSYGDSVIPRRSSSTVSSNYTGALSWRPSISSSGIVETPSPHESDIEMILSPTASPVKIRDTV
ncbi:hypothetical protein McanMca71_003431 [Microsporum canis]